MDLDHWKAVLGVVADTLSVIGFFLTLFVAWSVRRIQRLYVFTARVPQLVQRLEEHSSELTACLQTLGGSRQQIVVILGQCEATLRSLESKLEKGARGNVRRLQEAVLACDVRRADADKLFRIYADLMKVVEEVRNVQEDARWQK